MADLSEKLTAFLRDNLNVTVEGGDTPLISEGLIDSIQVLDVAFFLEREAGLVLEEADMVVENFDTIDAMAALCQAKG